MALRVQKLRQVRLPGTPFGGSEALRRDAASLRPGKAHNAQAGASRRSRNGDDGIGELVGHALAFQRPHGGAFYSWPLTEPSPVTATVAPLPSLPAISDPLAAQS